MVRKPTETAMDTPEDAPSAADRYRAPALDKGLDILEVLASQARGLTRAEIVKEMGLGPSQIYRMLERLVARGYRGVVSAETYDWRYFADPAAADAQVMAEYRRAIGV